MPPRSTVILLPSPVQLLEEALARAQRAHDEYVEAATADSVLATRLGIPVGSPLLRRVRVGLVEDRAVEFSIGHYRGDRYRYVFSLEA